MTDRSHRHVDTVLAIRESIRAEIQWREQLIEQYLCSSDPTMNEVVEVYAHLKRKHKGDVHLHPGGDSWATVRARDILKEFDVWDEARGEPLYHKAERVPLSEFTYKTEDGLDVEYVEGLVEQSGLDDATVEAKDEIVRISKHVDGEKYGLEIDFGDIDDASPIDVVENTIQRVSNQIQITQCDHSIIPDPGLDGTESEGDLLVCEHCPHTVVSDGAEFGGSR